MNYVRIARAARAVAVFLSGPAAQAQSPTPADAAGVAVSEKNTRPVLATRRYACHSAKSSKVEGSLWVDSREGLRKGGKSGAPSAKGEPDASLSIEALRHTEEGIKMPAGQPLKPEIVGHFEQWIRMGAPREPSSTRWDGSSFARRRNYCSLSPAANMYRSL